MLNCDQFLENLDASLDGELEPDFAGDIEAHAASCGTCAAARQRKLELRRALRAMPVPPAEDGFLDSVVGQAMVETHHNSVWFWSSAGVGSAVAAGVIAWLVLALPSGLPSAVEPPELDTVTIALNVEETFRLSFEAERELPEANLTVRLPEGVEVVGYEGQDSVRWTTDVKAGTNILELPIVVRSGRGGAVLASIEHGGKQQSFEFAVTVM